MTDIMVDLETLGQGAGCSILSIGAVMFDHKTQVVDRPNGFYCVVNTASCDNYGLTKSADTLKWWNSQSEEARAVLKQAQYADQSNGLEQALTMFASWMWGYATKRSLNVWGNGSDFDNAILAFCYDAVGLKLPWEFWNNRCYRTLKSFAPATKLVRTGTYHNALDDAISQAEHAVVLRRHLNV